MSRPIQISFNFYHFCSLRKNSARLSQADLSSDIQNTAERIIRECLEVWGRLDVLVNNASQYYPTEVGQIKEKDWNDMIQTNLCAPFFLSQVQSLILAVSVLKIPIK
jgi:pteridine reductase